MNAGCELMAMDEIGDERRGWEDVPVDGLPYNLLLVGRKR